MVHPLVRQRIFLDRLLGTGVVTTSQTMLRRISLGRLFVGASFLELAVGEIDQLGDSKPVWANEIL